MAYQNVVPVRLSQDVFTTSYKVIYRAPSNARVYIKDISIANISGGPINISVFIVPAGTTISSYNALLYLVTVAKNSYLQWTGTQILNPNDSLQISSDTLNGGTIVVSGGEAT